MVHFFCGIDWGTRRHHITVISSTGETIIKKWVQCRTDDMLDFGRQLVTICNRDPKTLVCGIESPTTTIGEILMGFGFDVYAINPRQSSDWRKVFTVSGKKDDQFDSWILANALLLHRRNFRLIEPLPDDVVYLKYLLRQYSRLNQDITRRSNTIKSLLLRYHEGPLLLKSKFTKEWVLELVELAPTPESARSLPSDAYRDFRKRHSRIRKTAEELQTAMCCPPLPVNSGIVRGCSRTVLSLIRQQRLLLTERKDCLDEIKQQLERISAERRNSYSDIDILASIPGVGPLVLATLIVEGWFGIRERSKIMLRNYGGVAPVTRSSGLTTVHRMRYSCNISLRQAYHVMAQNASRCDPYFNSLYQQMKAKGMSYNRAMRGIADRMLPCMIAMLKSRELYDPERRPPLKQ